MKLLVSNVTWSLRLSLVALRATSLWWPRILSGGEKVIWSASTVFSFFFIVGINIITQAAELVYVFGDLTRMTSIMLILITNMTLVFKMVNIVWRMNKIHEIVDEMDEKLRGVEDDDEKAIVISSDQFTSWYLYAYTFLAFNSIYGMAAGARKPNFPLPARFPYDTTTSPSYELTCGLQVVTVNIAAAANIGLDSLVTCLISQCCCRLKLLVLSLTKLCHDFDTDGNEEKTAVLLWSLGSFITVMMMQVFMYCYHGNELSVQSTEISMAAYHCLWYTCSTKIRRALLILMIRSSRELKITVGGLTILSLGTFMKVIKASYSFFTVLQSTQE